MTRAESGIPTKAAPRIGEYAWTLWTQADDDAYRAEITRLYRQRTPPRDVLAALPENRVHRSEARTWAVGALDKFPPETDREWLEAAARWYRSMSARESRIKGAKVRVVQGRVIEIWPSEGGE